MKLTALEEAFWYGKPSTDGTPDVHIPVKAEVIANWRRRLADFTHYRLPEMDKHGIDLQVLSTTAPGFQMQPDTRTRGRRSGGQQIPRHHRPGDRHLRRDWARHPIIALSSAI